MRYWFWIVAVLVVALDQWTKHLVLTHLPLNGPSSPLIPQFLYLTHVHNTGMAFSQLRGAGFGLALTGILAVIAITGYRARLLRSGQPLPLLLDLGLALPLGGAVGNMVDRLRMGEVVDFLDLRWWPVFNVADSAICVGAGLLFIYFLFVHRPEEAPDRRLPAREYGSEPGA